MEEYKKKPGSCTNPVFFRYVLVCYGLFHICGEQERSELFSFFFADAPQIVLLVNDAVMNNNVLRLTVFGLFQILADDLGDLRIDQVVGFFFAKTRDIISGDLLLKFSRGACIQSSKKLRA